MSDAPEPLPSLRPGHCGTDELVGLASACPDAFVPQRNPMQVRTAVAVATTMDSSAVNDFTHLVTTHHGKQLSSVSRKRQHRGGVLGRPSPGSQLDLASSTYQSQNSSQANVQRLTARLNCSCRGSNHLGANSSNAEDPSSAVGQFRGSAEAPDSRR